MKNYQFPRWSGPFVGMLVGLYVVLSLRQNREIPLIHLVVMGAGIGSIAGFAITLLEPRGLNSDSRQRFDDQMALDVNQSGVVGRFLAISGLLLCWTPLVGFILNLVGLAVNWKSSDWARSVSKYSALVGFVVTVIIIGIIIFSDT